MFKVGAILVLSGDDEEEKEIELGGNSRGIFRERGLDLGL